MNTEPDLPDAPGDDALLAMLAETGLTVYPETVQREVDALLAAGQSLEPAARYKLVAAAKRGTRERNLRASAALETLLFEVRRSREQDAAVIAAAAGLDVAVLRSIERGEIDVLNHPAHAIASWAFTLDLERDLLGEALRRSLGSRGAAPAYAGEQNVNLGPQEKRFMDDVLQAYDQRAND